MSGWVQVTYDLGDRDIVCTGCAPGLVPRRDDTITLGLLNYWVEHVHWARNDGASADVVLKLKVMP